MLGKRGLILFPFLKPASKDVSTLHELVIYQVISQSQKSRPKQDISEIESTFGGWFQTCVIFAQKNWWGWWTNHQPSTCSWKGKGEIHDFKGFQLFIFWKIFFRRDVWRLVKASKQWFLLGCADRDEKISTGWPFSLLNDEQISNKVRVESIKRRKSK